MNFSFHRVSIRISFWFVAVISIMLILFPETQAFYCFMFCIIHEVGHLLAMLITGRKISCLHFGYFGIKICTDKSFIPAMKDAFIAIGGPMMNLIAASVLFPAGQNNLALINLALAFFNLLPVSVLDGGHLLSALFPESKVIKMLSIATCILLFLCGIVTAVYSKKNFTLLIVSLYLITGIAGQKD